MGTTEYEAKVRRGAAVNLLGLVGKLLYPLLFLAITWLGEPAMAGLYVLAIAMAELATSAVQAGFIDAMVVYASHHVERADKEPDARERLYCVLAAGFALPTLLSVGVAIALQFCAHSLAASVYPGRPALIPALQLIGWTLPLIALSQAGIAATKARMIMEYDALLNGFVRPALLLALSVLFFQLRPTLASLIWALLTTYAVLAALSLHAFARAFSYSQLWRALKQRKFDRELLRFGIPASAFRRASTLPSKNI
jgi:O-antigen/teichoic acid export membrane protein